MQMCNHLKASYPFSALSSINILNEHFPIYGLVFVDKMDP